MSNHSPRKPKTNGCEPDIAARVQEGLRQSEIRTLRQVTCDYDNGVVTLRGRVPSFYLRQMVLTCVRSRLDAGIEIDDQLSVEFDASGPR
jgi:hypothetical protein